MKTQATPGKYHFLQGGGEAGQLMRSTDWASAGLDAPDTWHPGLKAAVRSMLNSPIATSLFIGNTFIHIYNDAFIPTLGKTRHPLAMGKPVKITAQVWEFIEPIFLRTMAGETILLKDQKLMLDKNGFSEACYMDLSYVPIYLDDGSIAGIQNILIETTEKARAVAGIRESEARFRSLIEEAPVATFLLVGPELIFDVVNEAMLVMLGKGDQLIGRSYESVLPELKDSGFIELLRDVYASGNAWEAKAARADMLKNGVLTPGYYDFTYKPLKDAAGAVYAIMCMAIDVTQQISIQHELERSQAQLLAYFEQSPVAIAIISQDQLTFRMANPFYAELVGRTLPDLIDKPLMEALPELKGQGFDTLLEGVISTGVPFITKEVPVEIRRNNRLDTIYVNLTYQPRREKDDSISGVLVVATDVTQQVQSRKAIEEAEEFLRGAIDLADLGTWSLDLQSRTLEYDERLRKWFGFAADEVITVEKAYEPIAEADRHLVQESMLNAVTPGTNGIYDVEYHIHNSLNGTQRILHAQGKVVLNEKNEAYKVTGTAQDVTKERMLELELKNQVQERTEELAVSNEELQAINEEMIATNEELEEANSSLQRSNDELEQFAYIASHDLQEPVRKISTFVQMLEYNLGDIDDKARTYLQKIITSTERMTILIRDVLAYSQVEKTKNEFQLVDLNAIISDVSTDFELLIEQKHAVVECEDLPAVQAIPLQMAQLFGNLLSNSLKYVRAGTKPHIHISVSNLALSERKGYSHLDINKNYFNISFSDNGIGFDQEQADKIFNIFQRLHGKTEFEGTGIGLSLCRKIMQNHGGDIKAISSQGKGATFNIIFPAG